MPNLQHHFMSLLTEIEPSETRRALVAEQAGDVRAFLQAHAFETASPHTRLSGSYGRHTAIGAIRDVDVLVYVPQVARDRSPHSVIAELRRTLEAYPNAQVEVASQRRSVRLTLLDSEIDLDLVPAFAAGDPDDMLEVPDRPKQAWIYSNPLGYAGHLSELNQANGGKLIRLVKLWKAWRDEQMQTRRPKSYMLELILFHAVQEGKLELADLSMEACMRESLVYVADAYEALYESGSGVPRVFDPETSLCVSASWTRNEFETFVRRVREARRAAERAKESDTIEAASAEWIKVFGSGLWPSDDAVRKAVAAEAAAVRPGTAVISGAGIVYPSGGAGTVSRPTRYYGRCPD